MYEDYESLGYFQPPEEAELLEAYSGVSTVSWYGSIERQLVGMEEKYQAAGNRQYADKIHTFLRTWRDNEITGSINRETIEVLAASAAQLSVDPWRLNNYFSNLRDQLRKLIASMDELPLDDMVDRPAARRKKARPPNAFGSRKDAPNETGEEEAQPPSSPQEQEA